MAPRSDDLSRSAADYVHGSVHAGSLHRISLMAGPGELVSVSPSRGLPAKDSNQKQDGASLPILANCHCNVPGVGREATLRIASVSG
jgi:hypothetical protein